VASAEEAPNPSRRTFLAQVIGACVGFLTVLIGIPVVGAVVSPALKETEGGKLSVGRADSFQADVPTSVELSIARSDGWVQTKQTVAVWVVKQASGDFVVFNGHCTHLGCAYHWQADQNQFECPCHGGVYSKDGKVVAGPPPRPLDTLETSVQNGVLQVDYVDYRLGVSGKVSA
jgi:menaquinol-cytochrome c reductase iron-sulfur subunit